MCNFFSAVVLRNGDPLALGLLTLAVLLALGGLISLLCRLTVADVREFFGCLK